MHGSSYRMSPSWSRFTDYGNVNIPTIGELYCSVPFRSPAFLNLSLWHTIRISIAVGKGNAVANVCQCGCGELLPEGSTRQYKRGHKARVENPDTVFTEETEDTEEPFTIDDAARETPNDPPPRDQAEFKAPKSHVRVTAAMKRDIEGKIAFGLMVTGQMWSMTDPVCGNAFLEVSPDAARDLTPILCQSPEVVRFLTKSGNYMLWVKLVMTLAPVFQVVFAHHIAKRIGMDYIPNGYAPTPDSEYVVQ